MRYPLPYAFARTQQLLLEEQAGAYTLWLHPASPPGGVSEVMRKYPGCQLQPQPAEVLIGTAAPHRHPLVMGPSSVHTNRASLDASIARIRKLIQPC